MNAPERIEAYRDSEGCPWWNETGFVTHGSTSYVRADLFAATLARAERAEAALADAEAAGMRRAAEECAHEEQVRIWAHDIIEGLGFADVLKISSYDDNIAAHEVVEAGVYRVSQSLTDAILAAIPAPAPWTPPTEAERPDGFECMGKVWIDRIERAVWLHITWQHSADPDECVWMDLAAWVEVWPDEFAQLPPEAQP